jgi:putative copper export protein
VSALYLLEAVPALDVSALDVPGSLLQAAPAPTVPPVWRWLTKWGYFLGLAGLIGSLAVHLLAVRPAIRTSAAADVAARGEQVSQRVAGIAAAIFGVLYVFQLVSATARGLKIDFGAAFSPVTVWTYLSAPAEGDAWVGPGATSLAQAVLVVTVITLVGPLARRSARPRPTWLLAPALGLAVLVTVVKSVPVAPEDLAAQEMVGSLLVQLHIVGGSVWVGGLAVLAVLTLSRANIRDADADTWSAIWTRFSVLAMASVEAIIVSGAWLTWKELGSLDQFVTTPFGRLLAVKILLALTLVGLGGFNQLVVMPRMVRLRRAGHTAPALRLAVRHLGRIVLCESVIGALVLLIVGLLTGSARAQAGAPEAVVDWTVYGWGATFVIGIVAAFLVTARLSTFLASRPVAPEPA